MKQITIDIYKIVYRVTGAKTVSLIFALVYITTLHLLTLYGIGLLVEGWLRLARIVHLLFARPYYIGTAIGMLLFNLWLILPLQNLSKERKKKPFYAAIIFYTVIAILLFLYTRYSNELF